MAHHDHKGYHDEKRDLELEKLHEAALGARGVHLGAVGGVGASSTHSTTRDTGTVTDITDTKTPSVHTKAHEVASSIKEHCVSQDTSVAHDKIAPSATPNAHKGQEKGLSQGMSNE